MPVPKSTDCWVLEGMQGLNSLQLQKGIPIPELGDHDVLVQIAAVSLNYRDLIIPKGKYPFPLDLPKVPCSDGAGHVLAVGNRVSRFSRGDKVVTLFNQSHEYNPITADSMKTGLGGALDGTLRQFGVFPETGLVSSPTNLTAVEACTLSCAPLTAWNALYGLQQSALKPGDTVLTQGTGGVSLSAIQFSLAAGANVIATTSSDAKESKLRKMGVKHIINYKTTPNWGEIAKSLTPRHRGVDHVIEVGGPATLAQSIKAIRPEGVITVIGFLGGGADENQPGILDTLAAVCTVRGILVGSRQQMEEMNRAIEVNDIHPVVDEGKKFKFEHAKEAYEYQWDQKHFGKVVIHVH
ncbi:hypothetical protein AJ80_08664 [Polytolypa hystricis UAMH7299]|uniref:Enoyl reductase (ER) domain-containing protein n=1 Tax=Polytolypa hystricis (strain UAMH7299) TaxID=1447883 RepID=A0A2B7X4D9_POLH7|nr:hypothetical protein AJ80_08664 [Polytolypa hystricis UAMH7299]